MNSNPGVCKSFWLVQGGSISDQPQLTTLSKLVIMVGLKLSLGEYCYHLPLLFLSTVLNFRLNVSLFLSFFFLCRDPANELVSVEKYKSDVRRQIINDGYRIWGILGDQYSSIEGIPSPKRAFKLPNPMYYVA